MPSLCFEETNIFTSVGLLFGTEQTPRPAVFEVQSCLHIFEIQSDASRNSQRRYRGQTTQQLHQSLNSNHFNLELITSLVPFKPNQQILHSRYITAKMVYTLVVHLYAKEDKESIDKLVAKLQEASQVYSNDKETLGW